MYHAPLRRTSRRPDPEHPITDRNLLLGHLRAVWWNHWREGTRLPAERGVILIDGGLS
jgi:hypothetical protein